MIYTHMNEIVLLYDVLSKIKTADRILLSNHQHATPYSYQHTFPYTHIRYINEMFCI